MNEENEDVEPGNLNRLKSYSEENMIQYAPTLQIGNYRQYDNNLFDRLEKEEQTDNLVNDKSKESENKEESTRKSSMTFYNGNKYWNLGDKESDDRNPLMYVFSSRIQIIKLEIGKKILKNTTDIFIKLHLIYFNNII